MPEAGPAPSRVLELTGYPDPGPMAGIDWLTGWRLDWLFLGTAVLAVGLYLAGVLRLHRQGDAWPVLRTVCWSWAGRCSCGRRAARRAWGRVLFSVHMVMHMVVAMLVPLLLVPGAPVTLALRTLKARPDKTWGPREAAAPGRALEGDARAVQPGRRSGVLLLQPRGVLLDGSVRAH